MSDRQKLVPIGGGYAVRKAKPVIMPEGQCETVVDVPPPYTARCGACGAFCGNHCSACNLASRR
jgi:hypothetical protein